ncbi:MAG: preprotein translocase subunit YajC [Alphaproteobacteria bacterium]
MFISPALAQDAAGGAGSGFISFLPLVLIFVVFYFLLIRPQQKKMKAHREMVQALKRGDRVVTGGGIVGQVTRVTGDAEVQVEIAEGVRVSVMRGTITDILSRSEPADSGGGGNAASGPVSGPSNDQGKGGIINRLMGR